MSIEGEQDVRGGGFHRGSGVGNRASVFYARNKYEDTNAFIVVTASPHTLGISVAAEDGKPAESVQPQAVALAKIVVAKLRRT